MYLRECLLENVGSLEFVDLSLPLDAEGNPRPVVFVGQNGSGKTNFLSHIADALIEFAKEAYQDVLVGQGGVRGPFFKVVGSTTQRTGTEFGIALLEFADGESTHCYIDKSGTLDPGV
jgi:predicted ATPase